MKNLKHNKISGQDFFLNYTNNGSKLEILFSKSLPINHLTQ